MALRERSFAALSRVARALFHRAAASIGLAHEASSGLDRAPQRPGAPQP